MCLSVGKKVVVCLGKIGATDIDGDGRVFFFFQAEDGIRDLVRSRGLGDVYKRQVYTDSILQVHTSDCLLQMAELIIQYLII